MLYISLKTTEVILAQSIFYIIFLFVREKVLVFQTQIEYTITLNMLADVLTKDLASGVFQNHVTHMRVTKSFDVPS